jgi:hypothetical protein
VVCLAAMSAMRFDMSVLYARHQEDLQASQQEHSAGPRQPTLHELWGLDSQGDVQDADQVSPVQRAQARAVAEFWAVLHSFAFLHDGHHEGQWWGAGQRPERHPFLASTNNLQGSLRVVVPGL